MIFVTKMHTNGHTTSKRKELQGTCRTPEPRLLSCSAWPREREGGGEGE